MTWFGTVSAGLIQERWADDFSIGSRLVLHVVAGIFLFGAPGVTAYDAKGLGGGVVISGRRRHCIRLFLVEALMYMSFEENHFNFFQMLCKHASSYFFFIHRGVYPKTKRGILPSLFQ